MVTETDLALGDGRTLHVYDTGTGDGTTGLAVFWQHGTPSTDALGIGRFAVMGDSGGGPHALACAAVMPGGSWPRSACRGRPCSALKAWTGSRARRGLRCMLMDGHRGRPGPGNRPGRDSGRRPGLRHPLGPVTPGR